ncbi:MAG: class I SAM-dependent methyltransferase [Burkholderiaceae bacterium]
MHSPSRRRTARLLSGSALIVTGAAGAGCSGAPPSQNRQTSQTAQTSGASPTVSAGTVDPAPFRRLLAAPHRRPANVARDPHRHPAETLAFFGVRPDSTVVEILPGSAGYYMEILAPYLAARGRYIAANRDQNAPPNYLADHARLLERLRAEPALYGKVQVTPFNADKHEIAPAGSADFVLTFRNLHNWIDRNEVDGALRAFHRALKPGGVLGVVDHRGRDDLSQQAQMNSGYVRQDFATALIGKAGFRLVGSSEVNANPKDGKDHPAGVWTLPPTYRLKDQDRARYEAIGESDRFTLKFVRVG